MLLDEPLSNLDAELRSELRDELSDIHRRLGITMVYVTHDQTEALALSDQVLVMRNGRIVERGEPKEIYDHPATAYGAEFVGASNCVKARPVARTERELASFQLANGRHVLANAPDDLHLSAQVLLVVKPEDIAVAANGDDAIPGCVTRAAYLGPRVEISVDTGHGVVLHAILAKQFQFAPGDPVRLRVPVEAIHVIAEADLEGSRKEQQGRT